MEFTKIPANTFEQIQLNAGILVDDFDPATLEIGNILGGTSGGISFSDTQSYKDYGDDIDNCPKNMMELKKLESHEVKMSGTFVTLSPATAKTLVGSADVDPLDNTHIIPRNDILKTDFKTIWWIGDYSDVNIGANAGYIAIKLLNALNTGGFQIQSTDKEKGKFAFEFMGHYSMDAQDKVPYEMYIKQGNATPTPSVNLDKHSVTVDKDATVTLTAVTVPNSAVITWTSADDTVASVSNGVVTGEAEGDTIVTATITVDGVDYNDTCTIIVTE